MHYRGRGGGGHVLPGKFEVAFFLSFLHTPRKMHATRPPSFVREIPKRTRSFSCAIFSVLTVVCSCFPPILLSICVVVQFYPWFKFYFPLFLGMAMYDNELKTKENKV